MKAPGYRNYLLGVLMIILAFNNVDRLALGLLLQDIKIDLDLSDTQLGFLTGIAFALFYSVMGIPIARWADRGNRVAIISISTALWSVALASSALVGSFLQMMFVRICVAVGEAGCMPPAHSLIADYFARSERPRAVAIYMLGIPLSVVAGYFLAGWFNEFYGWRVTFMLLGVPGIVLGGIAWLTLKEPRRERRVPERAELAAGGSFGEVGSADLTSATPSLRDVCRTLWGNATFRHLLFGYSVACFFGYGISQWKPAFFMRSFGLQTGEVGTWFAAIYGIGGVIGAYLGGDLASRYAAQNERLQLKAMSFAYCAFGLISACIYLSPGPRLAFCFLALSLVGYYMTLGPFFAVIQTLVPTRMRAMSIAIVYLFANLIGMGLGPLAAGVLSDALRPWLGEDSLRYALLALCPGYMWCAWHLSRASRTVVRDLATVQIIERDGADESVLRGYESRPLRARAVIDG